MRTFALNSRRSADVSGLTLAVESAGGVRTHGVRSARLRETLVYVHAHGSPGFEPVLAKALAFGALRVGGTVEVGFAQYRHVDLYVCV